MTSKLSGRYCFEEDGYNQTYCIPIELQNKFNELFEYIITLKREGSDKQLEQIELFNSVFAGYRLNKDLNQYSFTDLKEIEE